MPKGPEKKPIPIPHVAVVPEKKPDRFLIDPSDLIAFAALVQSEVVKCRLPDGLLSRQHL